MFHTWKMKKKPIGYKRSVQGEIEGIGLPATQNLRGRYTTAPRP